MKNYLVAIMFAVLCSSCAHFERVFDQVVDLCQQNANIEDALACIQAHKELYESGEILESEILQKCSAICLGGSDEN